MRGSTGWRATSTACAASCASPTCGRSSRKNRKAAETIASPRPDWWRTNLLETERHAGGADPASAGIRPAPALVAELARQLVAHDRVRAAATEVQDAPRALLGEHHDLVAGAAPRLVAADR